MSILSASAPVAQPHPDTAQLLAALDGAEKERARAWHAVNEVARASYRTYRLGYLARMRAFHAAHLAEARYFAALLAVEVSE